jgi:hypothetical protein
LPEPGPVESLEHAESTPTAVIAAATPSRRANKWGMSGVERCIQSSFYLVTVGGRQRRANS